MAQAAETVFESPLTTLEDVNKWEVIDSNNDDYTWAWDDYFELLCCSTVNADMAADDWLISPPITVEAGMYMLQFELRCSTSGEKIDIFYGNEATIDAMDNMLLDITDDDGSFITHTKMFTVENSGTIYLGFHAKSDAWSYQISLRNVKLSTSEGKDLKAVSISGLQSGYRLDAQQVKFTICNNGAADVSNFEVCYRINDGLSFGETVNRTLRPGETYEHSFAILADVSTPGDYKLEAWTALEGDELPGNDKVSTEFRHCVITDGPYSTSFETEDINSDIIDFTRKRAYELALRMYLLKMKPAQHTATGTRLIILHKFHCETSCKKLFFTIRFQKITPRISKYFRLYFIQTHYWTRCKRKRHISPSSLY